MSKPSPETLLNTVMELVCTADGTHFDYLNPRWEEVLGYSPDELRAEPFLSFVHPEDIDRTQSEVAGMLKEGLDTIQFENRYRHKDGSYRWLSWNARVLDGVFVCAARDITAYKEREFILNAMVNTPSVGVLLIDPKGRITSANSYMEALAEQPLVGKTVEDLVPMQFRKGHVHHRETFDNKPRLMGNRDLSMVTSSGRIIPVAIGITPLGGRGNAISVVDLTDLKAAVRDLEHRNEELQQFAYIVSHDLQEPLRAITGHLGFIDQSGFDADTQESMKFVLEGAEHMKSLIEGILAFSRVHSRSKERERVPLFRPMRKALRLLDGDVQATGAVISLPEQGPDVLADETQLVQVFQNIFSNALKYRHPDRPPHITVSVGSHKGFHRITVSDNGVGFNSTDPSRAFLIFQRLHPRSKFKGTGVGLSVVRRIVQRHGGDATISSKLGEGTTVTFTLATKP